MRFNIKILFLLAAVAAIWMWFLVLPHLKQRRIDKAFSALGIEPNSVMFDFDGKPMAVSCIGTGTLIKTKPQEISLGPIQVFDTLERLELIRNKVTSLVPLQSMKNLKTLVLVDCEVCHLNDQNPLRNISSLQVGGNQSLLSLPPMPNLRELTIGITAPKQQGQALPGFNFSQVSKFPTIETMHVIQKTIDGIELERCKRLTYLNMAKAEISTLDGIEKIPNLEAINLQGGWLDPKNPRFQSVLLAPPPGELEIIARCKRLKRVFLSKSVTDSELERINRALPGCSIIKL